MIETIDLSTENLYIKQYILSSKSAPSILFIHGGPGLNSAVIEKFILEMNYFKSLQYNLIVYDQRSCGRSTLIKDVMHIDNIQDLDLIIRHIKHTEILSGVIAHSYGAKLLFDYLQQFGGEFKSVFIGTAHDILTPRINNLMLDLNYLKLSNPDKYQEMLIQFNVDTIKDLWEQTEKLSTVFNQNPHRTSYYWANLDVYNIFKKFQSVINLPCNMSVFETVRKDLYSKDYNLYFEKLNTPHLLINGFHDYVMNGYNGIYNKQNHLKVFSKSGHYPHLEENEKFCDTINKFI